MKLSLTGNKKLERKLKKLPAKVQRNIVRKGMRKGLALLRKEARSLAPVDTGRLKKAIKTKVSLRSSGDITGRVFVKYKGKGAAPYSHLVEWGGEKNSPSRFMTRTLEANADNAINEFRKSLKELIMAEAVK
jgi:HK97 gp10 family phage protein